MKVSLDATPLLGQRTGVGRYVERLLAGLLETASNQPGCGLSITLVPFTFRGATDLPVPPGTARAHRRLPARLLRALWSRTSFPPVEVLAGPCDVFHATNFVLPPSRRAAGVVTVHDLTWALHSDTVRRDVQQYRRLVPDSVRRAQLVLCPAESTADDVADFFRLDRALVRATPLGVDDEWLQTRRPGRAALSELRLPERYFVFVGSREPRKNVEVLLAAHREAIARAPRLVPPLVLVGPAGWGASTPLHPGVLSAGYLSDDELRLAVAGAECLVLPSRYEGFGLPLLEALACGCPVVATDIAVHREVTGGHARLVPAGDVGALADVLVDLSGTERSPAEDDARRAWAAGWTWSRCAELTLKAYADAAAFART